MWERLAPEQQEAVWVTVRSAQGARQQQWQRLILLLLGAVLLVLVTAVGVLLVVGTAHAP